MTSQKLNKILIPILNEIIKASDLHSDIINGIILEEVIKAFPTIDITTGFGRDFLLDRQDELLSIIETNEKE